MKLLAWAIAVLTMLGAPWAAQATPGDEVYAVPARLVTASDGAKLNLNCMGHGSPTIVFDAGDGDWSPAWSIVQPRVAAWTRACSYDRAGYGFSGPAPEPRTVERMAEELSSALHAAGVRGPYILVGHAFGSHVVRAFADLHMAEVAGMVLIDPDVRDQQTDPEMKEIWRGILERNLGHMRMCRDVVAQHGPFPPAPPADHPGWTCVDYSFRGVPDPSFSPALNAAVLEIMSTKVAFYDAVIGEHEQWLADDAWLSEHRRGLGSRPLRIVTSAHHITETAPSPPAVHAMRMKFNQEEKASEGRLLDLSSNAGQVYSDTGAFVQLERPDLVVDTLREVYEQSRAHLSGRSSAR